MSGKSRVCEYFLRSCSPAAELAGRMKRQGVVDRGTTWQRRGRQTGGADRSIIACVHTPSMGFDMVWNQLLSKTLDLEASWSFE